MTTVFRSHCVCYLHCYSLTRYSGLEFEGEVYHMAQINQNFEPKVGDMYVLPTTEGNGLTLWSYTQSSP